MHRGRRPAPRSLQDGPHLCACLEPPRSAGAGDSQATEVVVESNELLQSTEPVSATFTFSTLAPLVFQTESFQRGRIRGGSKGRLATSSIDQDGGSANSQGALPDQECRVGRGNKKGRADRKGRGEVRSLVSNHGGVVCRRVCTTHQHVPCGFGGAAYVPRMYRVCTA